MWETQRLYALWRSFVLGVTFCDILEKTAFTYFTNIYAKYVPFSIRIDTFAMCFRLNGSVMSQHLLMFCVIELAGCKISDVRTTLNIDARDLSYLVSYFIYAAVSCLVLVLKKQIDSYWLTKSWLLMLKQLIFFNLSVSFYFHCVKYNCVILRHFYEGKPNNFTFLL